MNGNVAEPLDPRESQYSVHYEGDLCQEGLRHREIAPFTLMSLIVDGSLNARSSFAGLRVVIFQSGWWKGPPDIYLEQDPANSTRRLLERTKKSSSLPYLSIYLGIYRSPESGPHIPRYTLRVIGPIIPANCLCLFDCHTPWSDEAPIIRIVIEKPAENGRGRRLPSAHHLPGVQTCALRILPTACLHRSRFPGLSPSLARILARYIVTDRKELGWSRHLLDFALLESSFLPALDIAFEDFGKDVQRIWRPEAFFRHVVKNHHRACDMTTFDIRDLNPSSFEDAWLRASEDFVRFLPNLKVLRANLQLVSKVGAERISELRQMETLIIKKVAMDGQLRKGLLSLLDMQRMLAGLYKLRNLSLSGYGRQMDLDRTMAAQDLCDIPPSYQLETLTLADETVTSSQLLYFISPSEPSSFPSSPVQLRELHLFSVKGLGHLGLITFLSLVSSTLEVLTVLRTTTDPLFESDPTSAVDAVLPTLTRLKKLDLHIDLLTPFVLTWDSPVMGTSKEAMKRTLGIHGDLYELDIAANSKEGGLRQKLEMTK